MNLIPWKKKQEPSSQQRAQQLVKRDEFHGEMDRMFERFFRDPWGSFAWPEVVEHATAGYPTVEVSDSEKDVTVRAEIAGAEAKDLNLAIRENVLTIEGEKKQTSEAKDGNVFRSECAYGHFRRDVVLPAVVDEEQVDAKFSNGVLTIRMQKTKNSQKKKIEIRTS